MRLGWALIAVGASAAAMGCGLNQEGIAPPKNQIFYPGGLAVDPAGQWLYVVNSNADLRYNDGTLAVVDLTKAAAAADRSPGAPNIWAVCPSIAYIYPSSSPPDYCCWDALDRNILDCDERSFVVADATVKIGSFGSAIQVQSADDGSTQRLLVAVRGNASITSIDTSFPGNTVALRCTDATPNPGDLVECDEAHQVHDVQGTLETSTPVPLPEEPYALALDPVQKLLFVGHLRGGFLSVLDLFHPDTVPTLVGSFPTIFPGDVNGSAGVTSLTLRSTGINDGRVYATSRYLPRAGAFATVSAGMVPAVPAPGVDPNQDIFLANAGDGFVSPLAGSEIRGIQFIDGIYRAFLLQRTPPALLGFDTVDGQNVAGDVLEMCSGPTFLYKNSPTGSQDDVQLFVTCFESGQVYVVDPYVPKLVTIIEVGRGPAGLAFSNNQNNAHPRAYVVGFGANNVSVIDLERDSPTRYHVIQRIGFPSPVPR